MTAVENSVATLATEAERSNAPPPSVWRFLAAGIGWFLLAGLGAPFVAGLVLGIAKAAFQWQQTPAFRLLLLSVAGAAGSIALSAVSIARAKAVGDGDARRGLGLAPIAKLPIIVALAIVVVAYAALVNYAAYKTHPQQFFQTSSVSPWLILFNVLAVGLLAPVAEEFFFRGWLWTGLRQHWNALATALVTSTIWLLGHLEVSHVQQMLAKVTLLVPVAFILCVARQVGKSVKATILLHAVYNVAGSTSLIVLLLSLYQSIGATVTPAANNLAATAGNPSADNPPATSGNPSATNPPATAGNPSATNPPATAGNPSATSPPATIAGNPSETVMAREIFSGSQSSIAAMNYVNTDCSSGPTPEVRIVTPPSNGSVRLSTATIPLARDQTNPLARCNGKPVNSVVVFYQSNAGFTGSDRIVLDVDFRHGVIRRYVYNLNVR
jgi:membrane protease YdiL (CAAX protease family)